MICGGDRGEFADDRFGSHPEELALSTTGQLYRRTADVKAKSHEVRTGSRCGNPRSCSTISSSPESTWLRWSFGQPGLP